MCTIVLTNKSAYSQSFYFFQERAKFEGTFVGAYSNSIQTVELRGAGSGEELNLQLSDQLYVGIQSSVSFEAKSSLPTGSPTSSTRVILKEICLSPQVPCAATVLLDPLGLQITDPRDVPGAAFTIATPIFKPERYIFNIGLGIKPLSGPSFLSSFIAAEPNKKITIRPVSKFYVQTGNFMAGSTIQFDHAAQGAAVCDASDGKSLFNVSYNPNGEWRVT